MAERKRIGLIFRPDKRWMGGVYYILNLINALNSIEDDEKPEVVLLCRTEVDYKLAKEQTNYPYLSYRTVFKSNVSLIRRTINKLSRLLLNRNVISFRSIKERLDAVYPITYRCQLQSPSPLIYWIPDFQELHLPGFFSKKELEKRHKGNTDIVRSGSPIVLSSYDALKDLNEFYPDSRNRITPVFHFASSIPTYDESKREVILERYRISGPFFFCANQIWTHKNHLALLKAVNILKKEEKEIKVICSGNKTDYRNKDYAESLTTFISENGLENNVRFLGLIDREDLVCLMKESIALVQPSLFEGWNTGIEEAKALNKFMIVSDIPLHREQAEKNVFFFNPNDPGELADILWDVWTKNPAVIESDYTETIRKAGKDFMHIIELATH